MKPYLMTTALVFAVIAVAHVWEVIDRGHIHVHDILFIGVSAGLSVWAWRLLRAPVAP